MTQEPRSESREPRKIEKKDDFQINRVLSNALSALLLKTPLTPNQITFISLSFGILAGILFSKGDTLSGLLGAFSYQMACVLDNCDGEIARAKNLKSKFGSWLDIVVDLFTDFALFTGLTVGLLKQSIPGPVLLFGILCVAGSFINFLVVITEKTKGFGPAEFNKPHPEKNGRDNIFFKIADALREGDSSWFVILFAALGQTQYLLWFGGIYMQIIWISALFLNYKWLFAKTNVIP